MTAIPGAVRVGGFIGPTDDTDTYAVHDEFYGRGGWRTVADITARDAITADRRKLGMAVRVLDADGEGTQKYYTLKTGITNSDWEVDDLAGTWSGAYRTVFSADDVPLTDGYEFTLVETDPATTAGIGYLQVVTSTTGTGQISVELFDDVAKTRLIGTFVTDLAAPTLRSSFSFGFELETAGTLYGTVYCSGVPADQTASFALDAVMTTPHGPPVPMDSPYGNGIEDDGTGKPRVALSSTGGLGFSTGKLVVTPDVTSPVYAQGNVNGLAVVGAVDTSTNQSVDAAKLFDSVGCIPQEGEGYPLITDYGVGAEVIDSRCVKWRQTQLEGEGDPAVWLLVDNVVDSPDVLLSTSLASGGTYTFQFPVTGNSGFLLWLRIWAKLATGTTDSEIPFRARIYQINGGSGKDVVWQGRGIARQTALTVALPASQTYLEVSTNDIIEVDEGLVVYDDDTRYEFARCSARTTGYINISDSLEDANTWDIGSLVLPVTEWPMVPWINAEGSPPSRQKVYVEVRHDGLVSDPNLIFYAQAYVYSVGAVPPVVYP